MKILILGAGQVGGTLAENLAKEAFDITLVDNDAKALEELRNKLDIQTILGWGSHPDTLRRAGADDADMLIAVTSSDEVNMVACQVCYSMFRTLGAPTLGPSRPPREASLGQLQRARDERVPDSVGQQPRGKSHAEGVATDQVAGPRPACGQRLVDRAGDLLGRDSPGAGLSADLGGAVCSNSSASVNPFADASTSLGSFALGTPTM